MPFSAQSARQELLADLAGAVEELDFALASLGEAYDQLDEGNADRLEAALFRPLQSALGQAKRAHAQFAARHGLASLTFEQPTAGPPSTGARGFLDGAAEAILAADEALAAIQDSETFIEASDAELRAALSEIRAGLSPLRRQAQELVRTLGR